MLKSRCNKTKCRRTGGFRCLPLTGAIWFTVLGVTAGSLSPAVMAQTQPAVAKITFNIAKQDLATGLVEFSEQAGVQLVASSDDVGNARTDGVNGTYTMQEALKQLLAASGLGYSIASPSSVVILPREQQTIPPRAASRTQIEEIIVTAQ